MLRIELNTVTPAHNNGAAAAGSMSLGMRTAASVRRMQYSASYNDDLVFTIERPNLKEDLHPPLRVTPLICSLSHIWKRPRLQDLHVAIELLINPGHSP